MLGRLLNVLTMSLNNNLKLISSQLNMDAIKHLKRIQVLLLRGFRE